MSTYRPMRRIPDVFSSGYLWRRIGSLGLRLGGAAGRSVIASALPHGSALRKKASAAATQSATTTMQDAQKRFFDQPGLDTLFIRELTKVGRAAAQVGRTYLWGRMALGLDRDGRARAAFTLIPRKGYDQLMLTGLAVGTALGYFRGGRVHTHLWWDSTDGFQGLPTSHPRPRVRRFEAPRTLTDTSADIDDLYWSHAFGQSIKITRVGQGTDRRWIVSLPGTDNTGWVTTPNIGDIESNFREELGLPSAARIGLVQLINKAMHLDGIPRDKRLYERVLIVGHSQGGIIATALAGIAPENLGFSVEGIITTGAPSRRHQIRPGVAALAIENTQDIVPSLDGTPRRERDGRVVFQRSLHRPAKDPLFYAHSSGTYTDTLRRAERRAHVAPWGKSGEVIDTLTTFLPQAGEPTRVMHGYAWQDVLTPGRGHVWDQYFRIDRPDWEPITYGGEVENNRPLTPTPTEALRRVFTKESP